MPTTLAKAEAARQIATADDLLRELQELIQRVSLLSDACDKWLRDPDSPDTYYIGPRSHDVKVVYEEISGTKDNPTRTIRKKAPLSELLKKVEGKYTVTAVETKHSDPRDLLLKSYDRLQSRLELVAKLIGELKDGPTVNVTISPQWVELRTVILQVLSPYPEARQALARALESQETNHVSH